MFLVWYPIECLLGKGRHTPSMANKRQWQYYAASWQLRQKNETDILSELPCLIINSIYA